jgi:hypothetical protein
MDRKNAGAAEPAHGAGYNLAAKCVQTSKQMKAKTLAFASIYFSNSPILQWVMAEKTTFRAFRLSLCAKRRRACSAFSGPAVGPVESGFSLYFA